MLASSNRNFREGLRAKMKDSFDAKLKELKKTIELNIQRGRTFDIQVPRCTSNFLIKHYEGCATCTIRGDPNRLCVTLHFELFGDPVRLSKQEIDQNIIQSIESGNFELCARVRRPLPIPEAEFQEQLALEYPWLNIELREPDVLDDGSKLINLYISFKG